MSNKDLKMKIRSKINESDLWDDYSCDSHIEEFMKQSFIKFYIQILKWNKEIADTYYIDVFLIKCDINCLLMHLIEKLFNDIRNKFLLSQDLKILNTVTLIEETNPSLGQGFEMIPILSPSDSLYVPEVQP